MNIFRRLNKRFRKISGSYEKVYSDSRPLELCEAALLGIMEKMESCEPFASYFEEAAENSEE